MAGVKTGAEREREEEEPLVGALGAGGPVRVPPSLLLGTSGTQTALLPSSTELHVD